MDRTLRNTTATANTATNNKVNQGRVGGFQGKRHDLATKNKISQTQKARYDYMRQMMMSTASADSRAVMPAPPTLALMLIMEPVAPVRMA